jgi:hypothetical protein
MVSGGRVLGYGDHGANIKRGLANVVPEMKYAFFAHAHAICALRNDPTFDLAQSS